MTLGAGPLGSIKPTKLSPILLAAFLLVTTSLLPAQELDPELGLDFMTDFEWEDEAPPEPMVPEFSGYMPVWTQVYTEVRDLRKYLDRLGWLSGSDESPSTSPAASKPSLPPLAVQFDRVIRASLGISSRDLFDDLLGEHFAMGWGGPVFRDQFGIVCRVSRYSAIAKFLTAGKAQPLAPIDREADEADGNRVKLYRLSHPNLLAAVIDQHELILATSGPPDHASMFYSMVELAQDRSDRSLIQNPQFMTAVQSASPDYRFLFVLLTDAAIRGDRPRLGSVFFDELQKTIHYLSMTDVPGSRSPAVKVFIQPRFVDPVFLPDRPLQLDPFMRKLVVDGTDLLYASVIDTNRWYKRIVELANQGFLDARQYRAMIDLALPDRQVRERLIESLGPELLLLMSSETSVVTSRPSTRTTSQPSSGPATSRRPALALIVRTDDPRLAVGGVGQMFNILAGFLTIQNLASGSSGSAGRLSREMYHGCELQHLDLGCILPSAKTKQGAEWTMGLTWAMVDGHLMVTTSSDLARRLVDRALSPAVTAVSAKPWLVDGADLPGPVNWTLAFDPAKMAGHVKGFNDMLEDLWPAIRSPFGATAVGKNPFRVVLGIGSRVVKMPSDERMVVQVAAVLPGYPAWDKLRIGDVILDVDGAALDASSPQKDLHRKVDTVINQGRNIKLRVLRGGQVRDVEIPMAKFDGVISPRGLKMLQKLLSVISRKVDQVDVACNYAPDGQIRLQFEFQSRPSSAATTQPAR